MPVLDAFNVVWNRMRGCTTAETAKRVMECLHRRHPVHDSHVLTQVTRLENGSFSGVYCPALGLPQSIYGPYPSGIEHPQVSNDP